MEEENPMAKDCIDFGTYLNISGMANGTGYFFCFE